MQSFSLCLLPDETIYSYISRTAYLGALPAMTEQIAEIIGSASCQLNTYFPSFASQVGALSGTNKTTIINDHSVLPYFLSFVSPKKRERFEKEFWEANDRAIHARLSFLANRICQHKFLRYCPCCVNHDLRNYGVSYWHVYHQLPYVEYCPKHWVVLLQQEVSRRALILPPQSKIGWGGKLIRSKEPLLFTLLSCELFKRQFPPINLFRLKECYIAQLQQRGLCTASGNVRQLAWADSIRQFWDAKIPNQLIVDLFDARNYLSFPRCLLYKPNAQHHPIKHLLAIGYLFDDLRNFIDCYEDETFVVSQNEANPRRARPRVTLENDQRLREALRAGRSLRESAKHGRVSVGYAKTFALKNGFEIERRSQRIFAAERKKILYGLKEGHATKEIASRLQCSVSSVEQILSQHPDVKEHRKRLRFFELRFNQRNRLLNYMKENPFARRNDLKSNVAAAYAWCYKNDRDWLYTTLPPEVPRKLRYKGI